MRCRSFALGALLLIAGPAAAQDTTLAPAEDASGPTFRVLVTAELPRRPRALVPLYAHLVGLEAGDAYLTWSGLQRGAAEVNPLLAPLGTNIYGWLGLKVAASVTTIVLVDRLRVESPKKAVFTMLAINGLMTWVVWNNARVITEPSR